MDLDVRQGLSHRQVKKDRQGVSVTSVIGFMAWQLATNMGQVIAGHIRFDLKVPTPQ